MQCKPWPRSKLACPPSTRRRCLISCAQSFARITLVEYSYNDAPVLIVKKEKKNRSGIPFPCGFYFAHHFLILLHFEEKCYNRFEFWGSWPYSQTQFFLSSNTFLLFNDYFLVQKIPLSRLAYLSWFSQCCCNRRADSSYWNCLAVKTLFIKLFF